MSRYSHRVKVSRDGMADKEQVVVYGYDELLMESFIQVMPAGIGAGDDEADDCVLLDKGSRSTSKHEMVHLFQVYQCDEECIRAMKLDLPF